MNRTERWTREERTAYVIVEPGETVTVTYELLAAMLADLGFQKEAAV